MRIAVIDVGSNAIRFQVTSVHEYQSNYEFKKLEYVRFPLRLGHDVFTTGEISYKSAAKFKKLMHAFKLLLDLYEVDEYLAYATSAFRESSNGNSIIEEVFHDCGLKVSMIDGNMEAALLNKAVYTFLGDGSYLHIDVGGGSTELNLLVSKKKIFSKSFPLGSLRSLEHHDSSDVWENIESWVKNKIGENYPGITAIGTGGNINKISELANSIPGKSLTLKKIMEVQDQLRSFSQEERIHIFKLNEDRADVIIPASEIYVSVMTWAGSKNIIVPDVGLKDGMMISLWNKMQSQQNLKFN